MGRILTDRLTIPVVARSLSYSLKMFPGHQYQEQQASITFLSSVHQAQIMLLLYSTFGHFPLSISDHVNNVEYCLHETLLV